MGYLADCSSQTEGGLGIPYLLVDGAHIAREIAFSGDSAATGSRRVSAKKVHLTLIAGDSVKMVEYWLGASAR